MRHRTSKHRRYSDVCGGELTVHVTPGLASECDDQGKEAVFIRITKGRHTLWKPDAALCLSPLYEADSAAGRREAANAAVDFFEHFAHTERSDHE